MMRISLILVILLLSVAGNVVFGQKAYNISPSNSISVSPPDIKDYSSYDIKIKNTSNRELNLCWKRLTNTLVTGWDYSICDYQRCFFSVPAEEQMDPLPADASAFFKLNIKPMGVKGSGVLQFYVYDCQNPTVGDTVSFYVTVTTTGIASLEKINSIKIYPNPATERVFIQPNENGKAQIYTALGEKVLEQNVIAREAVTFDTVNLPKGLYFVRFEGVNHTLFNQKLIIH